MAKKKKGGKPYFELDSKGVAEWLTQNGQAILTPSAKVVEQNLSSCPIPVNTRYEVNKQGRPVYVVTLAHPSGLARQAKHGYLTKAASQAGLEVKREDGT